MDKLPRLLMIHKIIEKIGNQKINTDNNIMHIKSNFNTYSEYVRLYLEDIRIYGILENMKYYWLVRSVTFAFIPCTCRNVADTQKDF